jgi:hypothetical protein
MVNTTVFESLQIAFILVAAESAAIVARIRSTSHVVCFEVEKPSRERPEHLGCTHLHLVCKITRVIDVKGLLLRRLMLALVNN